MRVGNDVCQSGQVRNKAAITYVFGLPSLYNNTLNNEMSAETDYIALARKYRPKDFSELVGQEVLVTTLTNAIKNNKLHHAYILTGIRGVGKTSTARIIAKTINCSDEESVKTGQCCNKCDNCLSISNYSHQDVIEMDAASKTGVGDIREIIESIAYSPVSAKYKIYIIDEVHMLSNSAFNALLKTLEEPPKYVKFIFATTEIKKVPITILSRCQRFDLRRLAADELSTHIGSVLQKEGYEFEPQITQTIAKYSEGSVRDALSITDQLISFNNFNKKIDPEILNSMLGINEKGQIVELFDLLVKSKYAESLDIFAKIYETSSDLSQIITQLSLITHDVTKYKLVNIEPSDYNKDSTQILIDIAKKIPLSSLNTIWKLLSRGLEEVSRSNIPKNSFEMLLMRICYVNNIENLENLTKSNKVEKNLDHSKKNCNNEDSQDSLANEILQNFSGAKIL